MSSHSSHITGPGVLTISHAYDVTTPFCLPVEQCRQGTPTSVSLHW